jgi:hypothetical protein
MMPPGSSSLAYLCVETISHLRSFSAALNAVVADEWKDIEHFDEDAAAFLQDWF